MYTYRLPHDLNPPVKETDDTETEDMLPPRPRQGFSWMPIQHPASGTRHVHTLKQREEMAKFQATVTLNQHC